MTLKDFSYLDFERIRSFLAQMDGRLKENFSESSQHATGAKAKAGTGSIPKLVAKVEAEGNYLYTKSHSETSSLHHAIFDNFEARLRSKKLIGDLDDDNKPFTEIDCRLRVVDYDLLSRQFIATADVMPLITSIVESNGTKATKQDKAAEKAQVKSIRDIAKAVALLFDQVKVLQLVNLEGKIIAQTSLDESILPQKSLFFANNNEVLPEEYTVFCMKQLRAKTEFIEVQDTGSNFVLSLNHATGALKEFRQILAPPADTPSIIPIAIFRKLNK